MSDDQITMLMQYIDRSLDQRFKPVQDSISGLAHNIERIFTRLDEFKGQVISVEKDVGYFQDRIEENETMFEKCRDRCSLRMVDMEKSTKDQITDMGTNSSMTTRLRVELWVMRIFNGLLMLIAAYFLANIFDKM